MANLFEPDAPPVAGYAHVALEQGVDMSPHGLTYAIPQALDPLGVGDRVVVPLGKKNKPVSGYVTQVADRAGQLEATPTNPRRPLDPTRIKPILSRDPLGVSLPPDLITLAHWVASYYCTPLGMVLTTMLPAAVKRGTGRVTQTMVGPCQPQPDDLGPYKLTKLQKAVLRCALGKDEPEEALPWIEIKQLAFMAGARTVTPVKQLIDKGLLTTQHQATIRSREVIASKTHDAPTHAFELTADQRRALDHLTRHASGGFGVHLLHGVTGSGKTEVYFRLIEHLLSQAGEPPMIGAVVLVPEIALTTLAIERYVQRFGDVAAMHSGLTAAQRHEQWQRVRRGQVKVVVGARSAVFAPMPRVGIIIVDEEHDTSYKQDQLPRYHARDVAIRRAQLLKIPVVLGSATPSLESYFNATFARPHDAQHTGASSPNTSNTLNPAIPTPTPDSPQQPQPLATAPIKQPYHLLSMPNRVAGLTLPKVQIVDMNQQRRGRRIPLISQPLQQALQEALQAKAQALLLLNRRGYANYIACPDHRCGWTMCCDYCDAMMVYHKDRALPTGGLLRCHHCQAEQLLPAHCPLCSKKVTVFGVGTQRVEEELGQKFPNIRALRMDSDAMRSGRDYQQSLEAFARQEVDVLLGTQMIAKGLDFPNVTLVGVVAADTSLHIPDFRASERTFQLIAQVAGRAGRSDRHKLARVIVQSYNPQDPAIVLASAHDYTGFVQRELAFRRQVGLPPWSRMARFVVRDTDHQACVDRAQKLSHQIESLIQTLAMRVDLRGPMPCSIARIAGYHRHQIELVAPQPGAAATLQKLLTALRNTQRIRSDAHIAIDVDPVDLL